MTKRILFTAEEKAKKRRDYQKESRVLIVKLLGGICIHCGFSDSRALQIDHINGNGSQERKKFGFGKGYHLRILKSIELSENKYQLLCANCNWIKRFENKEAKGHFDI